MKAWYDMSASVHEIPVTRFVASWYIAGGRPNIHRVREWLRSLVINDEHLTEDEIEQVALCVVEGKLELQELAKTFV